MCFQNFHIEILKMHFWGIGQVYEHCRQMFGSAEIYSIPRPLSALPALLSRSVSLSLSLSLYPHLFCFSLSLYLSLFISHSLLPLFLAVLPSPFTKRS